MSAKTTAFFGASGGCGLAALKHTLAAGHKCIALCRDPSKLTSIFPPESTANLQVIQGNVHDAAAVAQCLKREDGQLVDQVVFTVGGKPILTRLTIDDPEVCQKGIATILEALAQLRSGGATGRPHITAMSTTGHSQFGRDVPLVIVPIYSILIRVPHLDKQEMEKRLIESGEVFTVVRASLLVDGESEYPIRVGVEDPKSGLESREIGYTISREDTGRWVAQNIVLATESQFANKIASITY